MYVLEYQYHLIVTVLTTEINVKKMQAKNMEVQIYDIYVKTMDTILDEGVVIVIVKENY